jgi:16S rRNA (cytosine1402-N4)-methyltransferase
MADRHETVLLAEAVEALEIVPGNVVVDGTLGAAGHFRKLAEALGDSGTLIGIDADDASIERAQAVVHDFAGSGLTIDLVHDNFRNLGQILDERGHSCLDRMLLDLGWNTFQLSAGRGFSFRADEPLLMTYGPAEAGTTAADLVNTLPEDELADLIYTLGEERFSRGIARSIAETRKRERILTTGQLADAVERGTPSWYHHRRLHPATKTFQALRIATNDELGALREALSAAFDRLTLGGRIAVITFHSIEDRIVKSVMKDWAYAGKGSVATRKPIVPSPAELAANPRARSAKLRVFERCNGEGVCITKSESTLMYV